MGLKRRNFSAQKDLSTPPPIAQGEPFPEETGCLHGLALPLSWSATDAVALTVSSVEEETTDKASLLDELIALIDDHVEAVTADKEAARRMRGADETVAHTALSVVPQPHRVL
ncbi:hypothetical protein ON010_g17473 [Phytophthora cinnamomi]|nr:hypothetical protein ON010_g17473 [Phytophthora cinnamomi]